MGQDIRWLGNVYNDVPEIFLPKATSGEAKFTDVTPTTAAAADVASGKQFFDALGVLTQGTASGGGGGASNVVTGTFTGTTTGAAMDVNLAYTGTGYPIAVMIFVSTNNSTTFNSLIQRYAIRSYFMDKYERGTTPSYSVDGTSAKGISTHKYKNSTTNQSSYSDGGATGVTTRIYDESGATSSTATVVKFKSDKKMSVYIASDSYGFAANIEYTYYVIYSS